MVACNGGGFAASIAGRPTTITDAGLLNDSGVLSSKVMPASPIRASAGTNWSWVDWKAPNRRKMSRTTPIYELYDP